MLDNCWTFPNNSFNAFWELLWSWVDTFWTLLWHWLHTFWIWVEDVLGMFAACFWVRVWQYIGGCLLSLVGDCPPSVFLYAPFFVNTLPTIEHNNETPGIYVLFTFCALVLGLALNHMFGSVHVGHVSRGKAQLPTIVASSRKWVSACFKRNWYIQ